MPQLREQHTKRQNKHNPHPQRRAEVTNDRLDTLNGFRLVLHERGLPKHGSKGQRRLSTSSALSPAQPTMQRTRGKDVGDSDEVGSSNACANKPKQGILGLVRSARVQVDEPDANRIKPGGCQPAPPVTSKTPRQHRTKNNQTVWSSVLHKNKCKKKQAPRQGPMRDLRRME